ncbi:MAG TPA: elongation factor P [Verrucomicrobiae bacterium]|jgi:elongation factor P|nr:elongation factor P [Verrucomicrobiae bacterium]
MVNASELLEGMVVRVEGQVYRVLEIESKAASAKLGGVVKAELSNVHTGRLWEARFRPQERLEDLQVERRNMEFLFHEGTSCTFMDASTFEQIEVPDDLLGAAVNFLSSGAVIPLEFFEGKPINATSPSIVEARVVHTAPPCHSQQDSAWKEATLDNGVSIRVPLFIAPEEWVRIDLRTGRYLERVHSDRKRIA